MPETAIQVDGIGKAYRLGAKEERFPTFRDAVVRLAKAPLQRIRHFGRDVTEKDAFWALKDVSFSVNSGEVIGIIGRNGAGKSTLLKIMSRITEPTVGSARLRGRVASLLEVGTGFHPELTGRENIYLNGAILGMSRAEITRKFDEIVAFSEVEKFLDTPVKHFSSGMYVRLAFAVAAHLEPEILIVDEVLAVGDAQFQEKCLGKMKEVSKSEGRTVLFVSHNMGAVTNLCSRAVLLAGGRVSAVGPVQSVIQQYKALISSKIKGESLAPGVIYLAEPNPDESKVTQIEVLDADNNRTTAISSLDSLTVRITFHSKEVVEYGSVILELASADGTCLLLLSTQPDGTLRLPFKRGIQSVQCKIQSLPLAAGVYFVSAGLAIPNVRFISYEKDIAQLVVHPSDVYGSGLAPTFPRSVLAVQHTWEVAS